MSGVRFVHIYVDRSSRIFVAVPAAVRTALERLRNLPALTSTF